MELAGLSVAQAVYKVHPIEKGPKILVLAGPGNNGGDGLVAARHLYLWGYKPLLYYPKKSRHEHLQRLESQLKNLGIPEIETETQIENLIFKGETDHIIDALFGFSFKPPMRQPFDKIIEILQKNQNKVPVTAVDIPSSWDVDNGPSIDGNTFHPDNLVSLTGPKPAAQFFKGRHFIGGRFISKEFAQKWNFDVPNYEGYEQVVEVTDSLKTK